MTPSRPILRWHGGKWKLAPWIIQNMPAHRTYVEPFGGAASVLLRKPRSYAEVYNDLDGDLVNLFRVTRDRGEELIRALELTPFAKDEFLGAYEVAPEGFGRLRGPGIDDPGEPGQVRPVCLHQELVQREDNERRPLR